MNHQNIKLIENFTSFIIKHKINEYHNKFKYHNKFEYNNRFEYYTNLFKNHIY